jgi:toxin-antitoxin system PIN domain toxin
LKTFLPDVNVWLALASGRHVHNQAAAEWFSDVGDGQAVFCRVAQMGLLRLLTNSRVMSVDVLNATKAWQVYVRLTEDPRIRFSTEPPGLEAIWRQLTEDPRILPGMWTDAYLQAFARLRDLSVVTFDKGFRRFADPEPVVLT